MKTSHKGGGLPPGGRGASEPKKIPSQSARGNSRAQKSDSSLTSSTNSQDNRAPSASITPELEPATQPSSEASSVPSTQILNPTELVSVGRVQDAHGLTGQLYLVGSLGPWLGELGYLFLNSPKHASSAPLELKLLQVWPHRQGMRVKLEGIADRTQAEMWKGSTVLVRSKDLVAAPGERVFLREVLGFEIRDQKSRAVLGEVVGFGSNGPQDLLQVKTARGVFDVPWVEALVPEVDFEKRYMLTSLPWGLLGEEDES